MSEPTTQAGRDLLDDHLRYDELPPDRIGYIRERIVRIEREAASRSLLGVEQARDAVEALGLYPRVSETPNGPDVRGPWQDGWNAGLTAALEALDKQVAALPPNSRAERSAAAAERERLTKALEQAESDLLAYGHHLEGEIVYRGADWQAHRLPGETCRCGLNAAIARVHAALGGMPQGDQYPKVPALSDDLPAVMFYENGDGEYYVPVAEEPDQRRAWQRAEASTFLALVPDGRETVPCGECEEGHNCDYAREDVGGCDAHPDCPTVRCPEPVPTDVWRFLNVDEHDDYRAGIAYSWTGALAHGTGGQPAMPTSDGLYEVVAAMDRQYGPELLAQFPYGWHNVQVALAAMPVPPPSVGICPVCLHVVEEHDGAGCHSSLPGGVPCFCRWLPDDPR